MSLAHLQRLWLLPIGSMPDCRIAAAAWLEERNASNRLASCTDLTLDDRRRELLDQLNVARERTHEIDSKQAHETIQAKVRSGSKADIFSDALDVRQGPTGDIAPWRAHSA
jgi:hypothetical protein